MPKQSDSWLQYSGIGIQMAATIIICWWLGQKLENSFQIQLNSLKFTQI